MEEIDWFELKEESKCPKTYWKDLKWRAILKLFFTALILGVVPCGLDIFKDCLLSKQFIIGDHYTYSVQNRTGLVLEKNCALIGARIEPVLPSWKALLALVTKHQNENYKSVDCVPDCSWLNQEFDNLSDNNQTIALNYQTIVTYDYSCFEQDPTWGWITLTIVFLPGAALFFRLIFRQEVRNCAGKVCIAILASLFFPLTILLTKCYKLFQFGEEWNRVGALLAQCEGQVENFLQAGLQWYIILSRPDREASASQWLAVVGSFVMIGFGQAKAAFANSTSGASMSEDIKKMAWVTFVYFSMIFYLIFTAVFISLFSLHLFFVGCGAIAILPLIYIGITRFKSPSQNRASRCKLKLILLTVSCLIGLISFIIGLVMFNVDPDSYSKFFWLKTQLVGNIILGAFSACNLFSSILYLFLVFKFPITNPGEGELNPFVRTSPDILERGKYLSFKFIEWSLLNC